MALEVLIPRTQITPGIFDLRNSTPQTAVGINSTVVVSSVTLAFKVPGPISEVDFNTLAILHNEQVRLLM
jgi:hypothetical protein